MSSAVEFRQITKAYGATRVLDGIDLAVVPGEFLVLVGPSGCGKSTLLRILAGLETATSGEIWLGERRIDEVSPKDRDIAMVFQNYALYPHMSVADNLAFALKMRKTPKPVIAERVADVARLLELTPLLSRKPKQLSGGQRQRVALGRAIVRQPQAFLMDEPLSNLDARLRLAMRYELAQLHQRLKTTTLYVTHDQVEALTLGQRIVVLNGGRIQQVDTPAQVYNRPANPFVANFIGQMNLLDATLQGHQAVLPKQGGSWDLSGLFPAQETESAIQIGFRPEAARLWLDQEPLEQPFRLPVTLQRVELLGHEQHVYCQYQAALPPIVVRVPMADPIRLGQTGWLTVEPSALHCYDTQTGTRLN